MTDQPTDFPPNGGHGSLCAYAAGMSGRCTCGPDASSNAFSAEKYPAAIGVFCDRCGTEQVNDFVVSDRVTRAQRFEIARKHLRENASWSCTEDGDYCPNCAAAAPSA